MRVIGFALLLSCASSPTCPTGEHRVYSYHHADRVCPCGYRVLPGSFVGDMRVKCEVER